MIIDRASSIELVVSEASPAPGPSRRPGGHGHVTVAVAAAADGRRVTVRPAGARAPGHWQAPYWPHDMPPPLSDWAAQ
jgi:hypothetical protein